jgi:hypothetical protein
MAAAEPIEQTFAAPATQVFEALRQTVADLGYKDVREDPAAGTIEFRTGLSWSSWRGQQMTATVREAGPDATVISLAGGLALKVQATSWGEKKRIAKKVLSQVEQRLGARPPTPTA